VIVSKSWRIVINGLRDDIGAKSGF